MLRSTYTAHTTKMLIVADKAAAILNASGKLDGFVSPTVSETAWGTSIYLQFRIGGEFYKVRYSDHNCLRSGEVECYTPAQLIFKIDRILNPFKWVARNVVTGRRKCEVDAKAMERLSNVTILSERVTSKGTIRYEVECDTLARKYFIA